MTEEKKHHNPGNPGPVTPELCAAFSETMVTKIDGIKQTIVVLFRLSTEIITLAMYFMNGGGH